MPTQKPSTPISPKDPVEQEPLRLARRRLLQIGSGLAAGALLPSWSSIPVAAQAPVSPLAAPVETLPQSDNLRSTQAYEMRMQAAQRLRNAVSVTHPVNGDEALYPSCIGNFSKGLPHNALGEVDPVAYQVLVDALAGKTSCDAIPLGGTVKLANPQAAFAYSMEGNDSHNLTLPPAPTFASADLGAQLIELNWQAITRDVPFSQYGLEPLTAAAIVDLQRLPSYHQVDTGTLFRGETPGDWVGPYLSQFLTLPIAYGAMRIDQRYRVPVAGDDHMTTFAEWLAIQNGQPAAKSNRLDDTPRYLRTGRDLGEWVHKDFTHQGFLNAALILSGMGKAALNPTNPYMQSTNQAGFVTFGAPDVLSMVTNIACTALKAAWAQKWLFHRHLRPEEFAGRVHLHHTGYASYPIDPTLFESHALDELYNRTGSYLLPQAYPEGCPIHPAYPAGHATIAGACVTVLKAFYNEAYPLPNPQVAADDGLSLLDYTGSEALTVGNELNKLAANVAFGRNAAGVHWRADSIQGLLLGEDLAISVLSDLALCYHEEFAGFTLTRFDGRKVMIM